MKKYYFKIKNVISTLSLFILFIAGLYSQTPQWTYHKSFGGSKDDIITDMATDPFGNIYMTGYFTSKTIQFDSFTLVNASNGDTADIFIVKMDQSENILWAKSFGGKNRDQAFGITADSDGNIYVTGNFMSSTIIFDSIVLKTLYENYFLVKFNSTGKAMWVETAKDNTGGWGDKIATDKENNVIVTGWFHGVMASFDSATVISYYLGGGFIVKYNPAGKAIWARSFYVTNHSSYYNSVKLATDISGNIYLALMVEDSIIVFIDTTIIIPGKKNYYHDLFIVKYDSTGNRLWVKKTANSNAENVASAIALDSQGNIYLSGYFSGTKISFDSIQLTHTGYSSYTDLFVLKLNHAGKAVWATSAGGSGNRADDVASSFCIDKTGNLYLTGSFWRCPSIKFGNFTLMNSFTSSYCGFITKYDAFGTVVWAKKIGTGNNNSGSAGHLIRLNTSGNLVLAGLYWDSIYFDTVTMTSIGGQDIFLAKLCNLDKPIIFPYGPVDLCQGDSVVLTSSPAYSYLWSDSSQTRSISIHKTGSYFVTVTDSFGCSAESLPVSINVHSNPVAPVITTNGDTVFCLGDSVVLTSSPAYSYLWSDSSQTRSISVRKTGSYFIMVTDSFGCNAESLPVSINVRSNPAIPVITANGDTVFCLGDSVVLTSSPAYSYFWSDSSQTRSIIVYNSGNYYVTVLDSFGCQAKSCPAMITVHPNPIVPIISRTGNILKSSDAMFYKWYLNQQLIPGATFQTYEPGQDGSYTVEITDSNGCSAVSAPFLFTGIETKIFQNEKFRIYPNPCSGQFTLTFPPEAKSIGIYNSLGENIFTKTIEDKAKMDINLEKPGVYCIRFISTNELMVKILIVK